QQVGERLRVTALEQGVEVGAVVRRVNELSCSLVLLTLDCCCDRLQVEDGTQHGGARHCSRPLYRQAGSQVLMVYRREVGIEIGTAWRVQAEQVSEHGVDVGLVEHEQVFHPIGNPLNYAFGVVSEVESRVAVGPAPPFLESLRQVPVVEA